MSAAATSPVRLTITTPRDFHWRRAVTSYGFYQLAPHAWDDATETLRTTIRNAAGQAMSIEIRLIGARLTVLVRQPVNEDDRRVVRRQVRRMLRLDEDLSGFHARHEAARRDGFGRLIRGASLFEDIVRTMTTCNVSWANSLRMNDLLVRHHGSGAFPRAADLASTSPQTLARNCRVGYRAAWIVTLARDVDSGSLDLAAFEEDDLPRETLDDRLRAIHGVGPYAAANIAQLLGRYDRVPVDSEAFRHVREYHGLTLTPGRPASARQIQAIYDPWAPHQFLAYWYELTLAPRRARSDQRV